MQAPDPGKEWLDYREKVGAGGLGVGEEALDLDELRLGDHRLQLAVPAIAGRINITAPSNLKHFKPLGIQNSVQ